MNTDLSVTGLRPLLRTGGTVVPAAQVFSDVIDLAQCCDAHHIPHTSAAKHGADGLLAVSLVSYGRSAVGKRVPWNSSRRRYPA